jgi:hypothetical protein
MRPPFLDHARARLARASRSRATRAGANGRAIRRWPRASTTCTCGAGSAIPRWAEARSLVERAALPLLPLRAIGRDVGITADGPVLIEGKAPWDPPQRRGLVDGEIVEAMRADGEDIGRGRGGDRP